MDKRDFIEQSRNFMQAVGHRGHWQRITNKWKMAAYWEANRTDIYNRIPTTSAFMHAGYLRQFNIIQQTADYFNQLTPVQ